MSKWVGDAAVPEILAHIRGNPAMLRSNFSNPQITIVFSDLKKRFTEFHRIRVYEKREYEIIERVFWIRIVKNKDLESINQVLSKQFTTMEILFEYLQHHHSNINLSCCDPIAMLPQFRTIITRECSGELFNTFLQKHLPAFHRKEILNHCFNIGVWLRRFHECFRENDFCETGGEAERIKHSRLRSCINRNQHLNFITLCHNDFSPRNIFVANNSIEVIDYVGAEKGYSLEDIEFFTNYVSKAKFNLLYSRSFKRQMISRFLEGYRSVKCNTKRDEGKSRRNKCCPS